MPLTARSKRTEEKRAPPHFRRAGLPLATVSLGKPVLLRCSVFVTVMPGAHCSCRWFRGRISLFLDVRLSQCAPCLVSWMSGFCSQPRPSCLPTRALAATVVTGTQSSRPHHTTAAFPHLLFENPKEILFQSEKLCLPRGKKKTAATLNHGFFFFFPLLFHLTSCPAAPLGISSVSVVEGGQESRSVVF